MCEIFYLFFIGRAMYSLQAGPQGQMQHNVCSPTPAELQQYSNFRAPRCRALLWFESIADRGTASVELVLNSNRFADTFPQIAAVQFRHRRVSIAAQRLSLSSSHTQRLHPSIS